MFVLGHSENRVLSFEKHYSETRSYVEFNQDQEYLQTHNKFQTSHKMLHKAFPLENPNIFCKVSEKRDMVAISHDCFQDSKSPFVLDKHHLSSKYVESSHAVSCRKFIQLRQNNPFQNTIGLRHYHPLD